MLHTHFFIITLIYGSGLANFRAGTFKIRENLKTASRPTGPDLQNRDVRSQKQNFGVGTCKIAPSFES